MAFNIQKYTDLFEKPYESEFSVSDDLGGGAIKLVVSPISQSQIDTVTQQLIAAPEKERSRAYSKLVREVVVENLYQEPEGFADFPVDSRPLKERAREYFEKAATIGSYIDECCVEIYTKFQQLSRPNLVYFRSFSSNGSRSNGLANRVSTASSS